MRRTWYSVQDEADGVGGAVATAPQIDRQSTHTAASHPTSHTGTATTRLATSPDRPTRRLLQSPEALACLRVLARSGRVLYACATLSVVRSRFTCFNRRVGAGRTPNCTHNWK